MRLLARSEKADRVEDEAGLLPVHVAASAGQVVKRYTGRAFFDWPPVQYQNEKMLTSQPETLLCMKDLMEQ